MHLLHTHTHTNEHFSNLGKSSAIWNFPDTNRIVQMRQTLHECKIGCKQRLPYIWFLTDLVLSLRISLNIPNVWPHSVKFRDFRLSPPRWVTPQKLICQSTWLGFNQSCFLLLSNKSTYSDDSLSVNEPSAQKKKKKKKILRKLIWQIITAETAATEEKAGRERNDGGSRGERKTEKLLETKPLSGDGWADGGWEIRKRRIQTKSREGRRKTIYLLVHRERPHRSVISWVDSTLWAPTKEPSFSRVQ